MPIESLAIGTVSTAAKLAETAIKDTWSKLDAAAEKPKPGDYLSQKAVSAIQGVIPIADKGE